MDVQMKDCCSLFYSATGIPVTCFNRERQIEAAYPNLPVSYWNILPRTREQRNPDLFVTASQGMYGRILLPDGVTVVLGPAYTGPASEESLRAFLREAYIPSEQEETVRTLLRSVSEISQARFLQNICLLQYCLTGERVDPACHFDLKDAAPDAGQQDQQSFWDMETRKNRTGSAHDSYLFEQQLIAVIREGDENRLHRFLAENGPAGIELGYFADGSLRQAKDTFIVSLTKVVQLAVIPGNLDLQLTYALQDSYIQECERCESPAEVEHLAMLMVSDFCRRLGAVQTPDGISQEICRCMSFIRAHSNEDLAVSDVAAYIGRSPSYLVRRFKREVGIGVGAYIARSKLEDAAYLLVYSDRSLAAISSYLCFSSQSYFQNVFKKQYGVTPMQYRKSHRKQTV